MKAIGPVFIVLFLIGVPAFSETPSAVPSFEDVSIAAGVRMTGTARGAAFGDVDGDGHPDLYVSNAQESDALFRNNGDGTFTDVTRAAMLERVSVSFEPAFLDFDNDGDLDLFVARGGFTTGAPNALYRNDGSATFTDVAPMLGLADDRASFTVAVADIDLDGTLEIYVGNGEGGEDVRNALYHRTREGRFVDITRQAGLEDAHNTHDATFFDYDGDGFPDLYLANGGYAPTFAANVLYRNNGDGTFTDVTGPSRTADAGWSMSAAVGDIDGDGDLDLYVANWNSGSTGDANRLFRNNGDGTFTDMAQQAGVAYVGPSIAATFGDVDNDGHLDLYIGTGGPVSVRGNLLYHNNGDGTFTEIAREAGVRALENGHGVIFGDVDRDGDLDLYVASGARDFAQPSRLYRNAGNGNDWLEVALVGTRSNRQGIGARVRALAGQLWQTREVGTGAGFGSQNDRVLLFGLGALSSPYVERLEVVWPSGIRQSLARVAANRRIVLREPESAGTPRIGLPQ